MTQQEKSIITTFGHRLRSRVCGICTQGSQVLMVKHAYPGKEGYFWAPPGGGVQFGESSARALEREFLEEAGYNIAVKDFLFVNEFMEKPLHAVELFFSVEITGGELKQGIDPEMKANEQIIQKVAFLSFQEIKALPEVAVHNIFHHCQSLEELLTMRGYFYYAP
ncbi:NUDIX domain-containing protein [Rapidithrix thailandica]|uniref:NUDIX domain-containing protein n=1 Tax=Rapidithrix thailandica TaxID=413964 RepID=A0AAW9SEA2_9BACT